MRLEARIDAGASLQPSMLPLPGGGGLLEIVAADDLTGARREGQVLVVPVSAARGPEDGARTLMQWSREWAEWHSPSRPTTGIPEPLEGIQPEGSSAPLVPPTYLCTAKKVWVHVICHGCSGRTGPSDANICPTCGSVGSPSAAPEAPLDALARRVRGAGASPIDGAAGASAAKVIPCVSCDRKETCFPGQGSATASEVLVPISARPWGATIIETLHLPWSAWCRLAAGEPWSAVKAGLAGMSPRHLESIGAILAERPSYHSGPGGAGFASEALLLRLEFLRQMLEAIAGISGDLGHPHLGLRPDRLWARLLPADALRPVAWGVRFALLDLAAAWTGEEGEPSETYQPPADRPAELRPPGCVQGTGWFEGLGIARTIPGTPAGRAEIQFIPDSPIASPPSKGTILQIQLGEASAAKAAGRVETGFPDLLRIAVEDPKRLPEEFRALFESGKGRSRLKVRVQKDHQIADDLYAAGTLWFASLTRNPADLGLAAGAREAAAGARQRAGAAASHEALAAACDASGAFLFRSDGKPGALALDAEILGRAVRLGLELCGLVPEAYAGHGHEPTLRTDRALTYERFLDAVEGLSIAVRPGLHGLPPAEREILLVLEAYERERGR